jgi:hypothetical protein
LRDASKRTDLFDPIKWIPLLKDGAWFLTLGGELRERVQAVRNPAFGLPSPMSNTDVFHRTFLFADLHLGPHVRTFVEFVNGETRGSTTKPSTFEQDPLDVLQAFADVMVPVGNSDFTLRVGRQQMTFGSARLVSFREAPNVRRAFDGSRAFWRAKNGKRLDAFLTRSRNFHVRPAWASRPMPRAAIATCTTIGWGRLTLSSRHFSITRR